MKFTRISFRVPAMVVMAAGIAALAVGGFSYLKTSEEILRQSADKLVALRLSRHAALDQYLDSIEDDIRVYAESQEVITALKMMGSIFDTFPSMNKGKKRKLFQSYYRKSSPAGDFTEIREEDLHVINRYSSVHRIYHPWFSKILSSKGYYDLFLVSPDGDVLYSVIKEDDFATNLVDGEWAETGLAKAYRGAISSGLYIVDYDRYGPSNGAPAAFISYPVSVLGDVLGYLVFQMPIDRINRVLQVTAGMGTSGETYLVGDDNLMRSASRFARESTILKTKVNSLSVQLALKGEDGVHQITDYRGQKVLSAFQPFNRKGLNWALLSEVDMAEISAPVASMRQSIVLIGAGIALLVAVVGIVLARSVTVPLARLQRAIIDFQHDKRAADLDDFKANNELDDIANAFRSASNEVQHYLARLKASEKELADKEAKLETALVNMPGGIVYTDQQMKIVFSNRQIAEILTLDPSRLSPGADYVEVLRYAAAVGFEREEADDKSGRTSITQRLSKDSGVTKFKSGDGKHFNVQRSRVDSGGFVTVITDVTELSKAHEEVADAHKKITEAHLEITQSIDYASHIQRSSLPNEQSLGDLFSDHFVIWRPAGSVGGDFYYHRLWGDGDLVILADCTGHGVPGAFMTLLSIDALNQAIMDLAPGDCATLIQRTHQIIQTRLAQEATVQLSNDGLEIGVCFVPAGKRHLNYAGANISLFIQEGDKVEEIRGDKTEIGYRNLPDRIQFTEHQFDTGKGRYFYLTTDGLPTQVGKSPRLPFGGKRFSRLLGTLGDVPMSEKKSIILDTFDNHSGGLPQRDDVSLLGFEVVPDLSMTFQSTDI